MYMYLVSAPKLQAFTGCSHNLQTAIEYTQRYTYLYTLLRGSSEKRCLIFQTLIYLSLDYLKADFDGIVSDGESLHVIHCVVEDLSRRSSLKSCFSSSIIPSRLGKASLLAYSRLIQFIPMTTESINLNFGL